MHAESDICAKFFVQQWSIGLHGLLNIDCGRQWLIIDLDQVARVASRIAILRDHNGYGVAVETHFALGQWFTNAHTLGHLSKRHRYGNVTNCTFEIFRRIDGHNARLIARRLGIDALDAGMAIRAAQYGHMKHTGEFDIINISRLSGNQAWIFSPFDWRAKHSCNTHTYAYPFSSQTIQKHLWLLYLCFRDTYSPVLVTSSNRLSSAGTHLFCSILDRAHNVLIAGAAADIALESLADFFFCGIGVILEQLIRGHNHARCAEATLQTVLLPETFLDGVQASLGCQSLDGRYLAAIRLHSQGRTGFNGFAIEQNGAGSTLRGIASNVRAGEAQHVS